MKRDLRISGDAKLARSETHRCDVLSRSEYDGNWHRAACSCGWRAVERPTAVAAWGDAARHRDGTDR